MLRKNSNLTIKLNKNQNNPAYYPGTVSPPSGDRWLPIEWMLILTSANWRKLGVESGWKAAPLRRTDEEVTIVALVLDPGSDPEVRRDQGRVRRLLRFPASRRSYRVDLDQYSIRQLILSTIQLTLNLK